MAKQRTATQVPKIKKAKRKKTLAAKTGVSQSALSRKIATVRREDPSISAAQASAIAASKLKKRKK